MPFGQVLNLDELPDDPQVRANETLVESVHPRCGPLREPRPAPRFGGRAAAPGGPAPGLGEHTDEILGELGLGAELPGLREAGIVA